MADDERANVTVTLESYERGIAEYLAASGPPIPAYERFRRRIVELLPPGARMLELGSGPGIDALAFEALGVEVTRTDAARVFVERLRAAGHPAAVLDVTTDEFGAPFDVVFANAVLLHLTPTQFDGALRKAAAAVRPDGLLAVTLKEGDGAAWSTAKLGRPRYFQYWAESAVRARLAEAGWRILSVEHVQGRVEPWLFVLCAVERR